VTNKSITTKEETPELRINNLKELRFTIPDTINAMILNHQSTDSQEIRVDSQGQGVILLK